MVSILVLRWQSVIKRAAGLGPAPLPIGRELVQGSRVLAFRVRCHWSKLLLCCAAELEVTGDTGTVHY